MPELGKSGSVGAAGEQSPAATRPLNDRVVGNTGHSSKSLRNLPLNGRNTPDLPFIKRLANVKNAAEVVVPTQLIVIQ